MKITREALILREVLSLLESLKPAQRERCMVEIVQRYTALPQYVGPLPDEKEADQAVRWNPPTPPIATLTGTQEMGVATGILGGLPTIKEGPHDA